MNGKETEAELSNLSDDIHLYFGLGCRNVTKIYVPKEFDFITLLCSFKHYEHLRDYNKYANNYDYQLSILLLNKKEYMTNGSTLLIEDSGLFSPIGVLHYEKYSDEKKIENQLKNNASIQCVIGTEYIPFGKSQQPGLFDYADGVDTMEFLLTL